MHHLKVFIDTEFTNLSQPELISLGMVAETGEEAYFEVGYDEKACSDFVRSIVIPLLKQDVYALVEKDMLAVKITEWLNIIKASGQMIEICFDHEYDWRLFSNLFFKMPFWVMPRNINYEISLPLLGEFYAMNNLAEHYALNDARANAYAFRERRKK